MRACKQASTRGKMGRGAHPGVFVTRGKKGWVTLPTRDRRGPFFSHARREGACRLPMFSSNPPRPRECSNTHTTRGSRASSLTHTLHAPVFPHVSGEHEGKRGGRKKERILCYRASMPCHESSPTTPTLTTPEQVTTSPGIQLSTRSSLSSHSTVRGMRPSSLRGPDPGHSASCDAAGKIFLSV